MGTELMRACLKEENDDFPSVPPGFESYTSFTLERVQEESITQISKDVVRCSESLSTHESQLGSHRKDTELGTSDGVNIARSRRRKPCVKYGQFDNNSGDESDSGKPSKNSSLTLSLPKGVIRGCPKCSTCQKVTTRWRPEAARRPELEDVPVFTPNEEEFEDTLKYIASIRPKAEPYGICRIVPPSSWKPPCSLREKGIWESSTFVTRIQRVDKLQNRDSMSKRSRVYNNAKKKRRRCLRMAGDCGTDAGTVQGSANAGFCENERFGFEPGPEFTLEKFEKYADDFKSQYFSNEENLTNARGNFNVRHENGEPSVDDIEGEYWRIVEKATEEIEVLYGADLETGVYGSGFPKKGSQLVSGSDEHYLKSGWNLNNFPRLSGSVLSYESNDISGVLVPWLYVGMCFSSFCWHVEDHHLYSLNYLHWGAPKIWYGVPGNYALKMEQAMRKHLPDLFDEQPDLLHKLVTQLSPSILRAEGVPVYRCVQKSGEFVLTFPRAYHSGFNCGFNCAEAVNVAPVDWLPHGQIAIELYRDQGRRTSISHDKLLLGAARGAVRALWELNLLKKNTVDNLRWKDVCGKDGILAKTFKTRVQLEHARRGFLCNSMKEVKMKSDFDATSERECSVCQFDLHLSAVGCCCSPDRYACLNHAKQFCSCAWATKLFLFRYDICELNILVDALEEKLSAVYRWARLDLGLALSSYISSDTKHIGKLSDLSEVTVSEELKPQDSVDASTSIQQTGISRDIKINISTVSGNATPQHDMERPRAVLALRSPSIHNSSAINKEADSLLKIKEERSPNLALVSESPKKCKVKRTLAFGNNDVILLSDDESGEMNKAALKVNSSACHSESSKRVTPSDEKLSLCNTNKDSVLTTPVTDAMEKSLRDLSSLSNVRRNSCPSCSFLLEDKNGISSFCAGSTSEEFASNIQDHGIANDEKKVTGVRKSRIEDNHEKIRADACSNLVDNRRLVRGIPSCTQNNLDRYFRHKGPRVAKVVRRITCNVEPLELGIVHPGKLWCDSQAIFPKGFKSRVKYMNVLDPTIMSSYISEILDAGRGGPLFMVYLEESPSEIFVHLSAGRCWEMVRERVNQEITKQHKLGKKELPPLQPPGSLDGFEMFGFSSPAIVQVIEALDLHRICTEYWDSRPYSRPALQIPQSCQSKDDKRNLPREPIQQKDVDRVLKGLFEKANPEELDSLSRFLVDIKTTTDGETAIQLLNEEIQSRPK